MEDAAEALIVRYLPAAQAAASPHGLSPTGWYGWLLTTYFLRPEHFSLELIGRREPYASPARWRSRLENAVKLGFLTPDDRGGYSITAAGEKAAEVVIQAFYGAMARLSPLAESRLERLSELLERLVTASLAAPEPPHKWALYLSRRTDPGPNALAMIRIDQWLTDLGAYRDDCHTSSWQGLGVSALAWEMLTLIWHGEAHAAVDFESKLERRGYKREAFVQALTELSARGWVAGDAQAADITRAGREVRDRAETLTDEYFYRPWAVLSTIEREELDKLLAEFLDGLRRLPAESGD
jgi:DNA-binding MarR family transcriptional regulator